MCHKFQGDHFSEIWQSAHRRRAEYLYAWFRRFLRQTTAPRIARAGFATFLRPKRHHQPSS
jgi:hypothetical protein